MPWIPKRYAVNPANPVDGNLSLWLDQASATDAAPPRPAPERDVEADVAIVGAGYTGLWTAYYLAEADPDAAHRGPRARVRRLRRVGPQRRLVLVPVPDPRWRQLANAGGGRDARDRLARARYSDTVDEVGRVVDGRGHRLPLREEWHRRSGPHRQPSWSAPRAEVPSSRSYGFGEDDLQLLECRRGPAMAQRRRRARRRRSPRTARRSTRAGSVAGWPRSSRLAA